MGLRYLYVHASQSTGTAAGLAPVGLARSLVIHAVDALLQCAFGHDSGTEAAVPQGSYMHCGRQARGGGEGREGGEAKWRIGKGNGDLGDS